VNLIEERPGGLQARGSLFSRDNGMNRARRKWYVMLVDLAIRLTGGKPDRQEQARQVRRASFSTDVSRFPLRMTGFLRERLRRRWLRIRRN